LASERVFPEFCELGKALKDEFRTTKSPKNLKVVDPLRDTRLLVEFQAKSGILSVQGE
jgi:hypothetical protein